MSIKNWFFQEKNDAKGKGIAHDENIAAPHLDDMEYWAEKDTNYWLDVQMSAKNAAADGEKAQCGEEARQGQNQNRSKSDDDDADNEG